MTQFKDKSKKNNQGSVPCGLLTYPTLMAADILLYDIDIIPVGNDQLQHLEFTRDLANRFNKKYQKPIFKLPQAWESLVGSRIMALQNPTKKMAKSDHNFNNVIYLTDDVATVVKKIQKATTDSENIIKYDKKNKPGISNLLNIYASIKNITLADCEAYFANQNYAQLKIAVSNEINKLLAKIKIKYHYYQKNRDLLQKILHQGAIKAKTYADSKLAAIETIIGINYNDK